MAEALVLQPPVVGVSETGRRTFDAYFTAQPVADALVACLVRDGFWRGGTVLEPSAGRGAFVRAIMAADPGPTVLCANDIDPLRTAELDAERLPHVVCCNYDFSIQDEGWEKLDLILGNPPYSDAEKHVRHALSLRKRFGSAAFLLRLAFLESANRFPLWKEFPASKIYVLSERPSFTGGGTDNSAYAFFVWQNGWRGPTEMEVISWREPVRRGGKTSSPKEPTDAELLRDASERSFAQECAVTRLLGTKGLNITVDDVSRLKMEHWIGACAWAVADPPPPCPEFLSRYDGSRSRSGAQQVAQ